MVKPMVADILGEHIEHGIGLEKDMVERISRAMCWRLPLAKVVLAPRLSKISRKALEIIEHGLI